MSASRVEAREAVLARAERAEHRAAWITGIALVLLHGDQASTSQAQARHLGRMLPAARDWWADPVAALSCYTG